MISYFWVSETDIQYNGKEEIGLHTNVEELNRLIEASGLRITYLADKCGLSRTAFYKKRTGKVDFTSSEIAVLRDELKLTLTQVDKIFLIRKCP